MKKQLLIISIFAIVLLTGCNANYKLEINDNKIKETFSVIEKDKNLAYKEDEDEKTFYDYAKLYGEDIEVETDYAALYSEEECINNCSYYEKEFIQNNDEIGFILTHDFDFDNYANSSIANEIIPSFSATYDGRYIHISGGSSWKFSNDYQYLDEININIKTNYKVTSTNLQKSGFGNYIWTVKNDKTNTNSKKLYITLDTKNILEEKDDSDNVLILLIMIVGGLIIVLLFSKLFTDKN